MAQESAENPARIPEIIAADVVITSATKWRGNKQTNGTEINLARIMKLSFEEAEEGRREEGKKGRREGGRVNSEKCWYL